MGKSRIIRLVAALAAAVVAGVGTAVLLAVVLAVVDLYLTGHGMAGLSQRWIGSGALRMSLANALFRTMTLVSALGAGALVYSVMRPPAAGKSGRA